MHISINAEKQGFQQQICQQREHLSLTFICQIISGFVWLDSDRDITGNPPATTRFLKKKNTVLSPPAIQ